MVSLLSLGYAELYFTIAAMAHRFKFELHETTQENIRAVRDRGLPFSKDLESQSESGQACKFNWLRERAPKYTLKAYFAVLRFKCCGYCILSRGSLLLLNDCQG